MSLGIPIIAIPQWSDQSTNAKLITDVWKIGIRVLVDEKQIVRRNALKQCILEIMESEKDKVLKSNAMQLKALAIGSAGASGSTSKNIVEFVSYLNKITK